MDTQGDEIARKRMKTTMEDNGDNVEDGGLSIVAANEETETNVVGSEEMEHNITNILEKIDRFTQMVSELLESGKAMFKELSNDFEDRLVMLHKEQMEKWQDEIKELRLLDTSNEEANALLHNARYLLQGSHINPPEVLQGHE